MRSAVAISALLLLPACAAGGAQPVVCPIEPPRVAREETVPGTDVRFTMVPLPGTKVWIGAREVTWDEYDLFALDPQGVDAVTRPSKPYGPPDRGFGHQGLPAMSITAAAAERYCEWLARKTGLKFRLPTVEEWHAALAEWQSPVPLDPIAWFADNSDLRVHPVGQKQPNSLLLYDLLGNVAEWCRAPAGSAGDAGHLACGGSYRQEADRVHAGARVPYSPAWQQADPNSPKSRWWLSDGPHLGFRLVLE
jgi:formylglycine-generating enzyme required for sulfatase activity